MRSSTLGVPPERAETGYGYIKTGLPAELAARAASNDSSKSPRRKRRNNTVASGEYWWNSGVFVMRASVWLAAITACRPEIAAACRASYERASFASDGSLQLDRAAFAACP
ncbi:mannose-1-phosphate guanylyltransferase/mannose-6-phosphate isomerase, partial [Paraburkholderia steynii]